MCWVSKKQDIKIAEQDIPIFKIMNKTNNPKIVSSYFREYSYELNVLEKTEIKIWDGYEDNSIIVYIALHSYSDRIQQEGMNIMIYMYLIKKDFVHYHMVLIQ